MTNKLNDVPCTAFFTPPDRSEKYDGDKNRKFYNFFVQLFNRIKNLANRIYSYLCSGTRLVKRKAKKATQETTATVNPPTPLSTDPHSEAKTDTDYFFEEKTKKATQETTATVDPPTQLSTDPNSESSTDTNGPFEEKTKKATQETTATVDPPTPLSTDPHSEASTDTDGPFEEKATMAKNQKTVTFANELPVSERPPLPPEDCIYGVELYAERINYHVRATLSDATRDMRYYHDIHTAFTINDVLDQLADFSELSSDHILDTLEKTGFFEENFLLDIKRLNVNLEGSPYW